MYKFINNRLVGEPNKDLLPEDASKLGAIIGSWYGRGSLVVSGRDYNPSSRMLKRAFISGLMSVGVDVMDFHESVSGEIGFSIKRFGARGGFIIFSHPWLSNNVLFRIMTNPGVEIIGAELKEIIEKTDINRTEPSNTGWVTYAEYIHKLYISALTAQVKSDRIADRRFRVVIDTCHGPADKILPELLSSLNIDFVLVNAAKPPQIGSRTYPLINDLYKVYGIVKSINADLGVIFNTDASAMIVVDNEGNILLPEETLLVLLKRLPSQSSILVSNEVFGFIDDILSNVDIKVYRMSSEEELIKKTVDERPPLSMGYAGDYINPSFSLTYDATMAFLKLLEALTYYDKPLSKIVMEKIYPRYYIMETSSSIIDVSKKICSLNNVYCLPIITGYRIRYMDTRMMLTINPSNNMSKILIDPTTGNIAELLKNIHKILKELERS
ncbi:phosphoglucomutase/phosphomannomutase alpha/beta/alpha domain I [Staphylothermus marinus F1]|uniref:Phosphoglucomutase/phosphomannomutase alpha/beta/alpha domain I n=1 Tax=Staphylothermus marinus (strain ATCC 43588 / DSM 3639 / JCM 9404 / F1) TaxID=399550 RepID=A3DKS3_STAMF|nr:phosphoglucomutase [Staphylothermus marinus]ABN69233.1 phosphoglucomutase/phosphomannomutase alpha/beta/alpha domain I [Staphylothermus marinus F1]